ncbi:MAG: DUF853 family protein [Methanospirillaceae archaeon]|nr:DUF853 family protein [Methanospirillaceae archaeon]
MDDKGANLIVARGEQDIGIIPKMANRHGLIAGATGTGKTVTLRVLTEALSAEGIPVFLADIKGDLSGIIKAGGDNAKVVERTEMFGLSDYIFEGYPATFWDVYAENGNPVRTTVSEVGPLLMARILGLNDIQSDVLQIIYKIADDNGLLLLDLKDLQSMCEYMHQNRDQLKTRYGNLSPATIGAIQRSLITLGSEGGEIFFGEPALNIMDLIQTDENGRGLINILTADTLFLSPKLYSTFLLWLLSELFEELPEIGDPQKPVIVFFFDEAHLLFTDTPKVLETKIIQMVRLIRSKGVGVYFVTQNPLDIPEDVLGQLGNKIQHALRAFTPKNQKEVRAAAETFRPNPTLDTYQVITELQIGEALVSFLDKNGIPSVVNRAFIYPPHSRLSPLTAEERAEAIRSSPFYSAYSKTVDRTSAYEILRDKALQRQVEVQTEKTEKPVKQVSKQAPKKSSGKKTSDTTRIVQSVAKDAARAIGSQIGKEIMRGLLGSMTGKRR